MSNKKPPQLYIAAVFYLYLDAFRQQMAELTNSFSLFHLKLLSQRLLTFVSTCLLPRGPCRNLQDIGSAHDYLFHRPPPHSPRVSRIYLLD